MRNTARQTRENRTITVDFQNEATYFQLLGDGKAFVECVLAFLLSLGFQLKHKATCQRRRVPDAPLALCPCPPGWGHHLACSSAPRVKRCSPSCPTSSCAIARCVPRWPAMPCWPRMGASVWSCARCIYHISPDGALSPGLCVRPPQSGHGADPVWSAAARLFPGR